MRNNMKTLTMLGALALPFGAYANAEGAKVGFEYSAGFSYSDKKFDGKKTVDGKEEDPKAEYSIGLGAANLKLNSEFGNGNMVDMKYSLSTSSLVHGFVHRKVNRNMDVRVGKMLVNQGGFNQRQNNFDAYAKNHFLTQSLYHSQYSDAVAIDYSQGPAKATVQLLNKPVTDKSATSFVKNEESGMDFSFQLEADVGRGVTPLFQYTTYDESNTMTVGASFAQNRISGSFDYMTTTLKAHSWGDNQTLSTESVDVKSTGISAKVHYDMGNMTPFFAFNSFKVDDAKDGDKTVETNSTNGAVDNNVTDISFGVDAGKHTDQFKPRLSVSMKSGKWKDGDKDETRSQMEVGLAVYGSL